MRTGAVLGVLGLLMVTLSGCLSDGSVPNQEGDGGMLPGVLLPPAIDIPAIISDIQLVKPLSEVPTGAGIYVHGHHAYISSRSAGLHIVNILDPENPIVEGVLSAIDNETNLYVRDMDLAFVEGRTIVVGAGQNTGLHLVDATNASNPVYLTSVMMELDDGSILPSHNAVVVPGTSIVYNSPSRDGRPNHIIDVSDPLGPEIIGTFGNHGCHDIAVRADLNRAYCAGISVTEIWDISMPEHPTLVSTFDDIAFDTTGKVNEAINDATGKNYLPDGLHHLAMVNNDGTVLIIGDEWQGGGDPGACFVHQQTADGRSVSTPMGSLMFVDITDEKNPVAGGWFTPPLVEPELTPTVPSPPNDPTSLSPVGVLAQQVNSNCTSHFGSIVPDKEQVLMAWYQSGIVLVDFEDIDNPYMVTRWNQGTNTWDAKIHEGWIITGDIERGVDVFKFI